MSEIEKLYENAGFIQKRCKDYSCIVCDKYKDCDKYSPFTAEKQLELIKWLASSRKGILISDMGEGEFSEFNISTGFYYCAKHIQDFRKNKDLSVVIAEFINHLWQDLTEEEKAEIGEILK